MLCIIDHWCFIWPTPCLQLLKLVGNILRIGALDVLTAESTFSRGTVHKGWLTDCRNGHQFTTLSLSPHGPWHWSWVSIATYHSIFAVVFPHNLLLFCFFFFLFNISSHRGHFSLHAGQRVQYLHIERDLMMLLYHFSPLLFLLCHCDYWPASFFRQYGLGKGLVW